MSLDSALAAVPTLLIVWACLTAVFVGLLTYRGQLTRYENEELDLNDIKASYRQRQSDIVRRVRQVTPLVTILGSAAGVVTVCIVGIWVADAIRVLR